MTAYAAAFDGAGHFSSDAALVVSDMAAIENMAMVAKAKAAARLADSPRWKSEGDRSPAHHQARTTGTTVGSARDLLDSAGRLAGLADTDEAARRGKLSREQLAAITAGAAADPEAERRLLHLSRRTSLRELRDEAARTKAAADPDPDARRRRIHAGRSCTKRTTPDGGGELRYRSTLDELAVLWGAIEGFAKSEFDRARIEGQREPAEAYLADGLLAMARAASAGAAQGGGVEPRDDAPAPPSVRASGCGRRRRSR